jgi:hypothetical protein
VPSSIFDPPSSTLHYPHRVRSLTIRICRDLERKFSDSQRTSRFCTRFPDSARATSSNHSVTRCRCRSTLNKFGQRTCIDLRNGIRAAGAGLHRPVPVGGVGVPPSGGGAVPHFGGHRRPAG